MRRILRGIVGTLLASGVLGLTRPAVAQAPTTPPQSPSRSLDEDLRLPTIVPAKPKPPPPVTKWGQGKINWESPDEEKSATPPAAKVKKKDTQDKDLRLPAIVPAKPSSARPAPSGAQTGKAEAVKPPAPVMKWGQSAMSWESTVKKKPATTPTAKEDTSKASVEKPAKKSKPDAFASEQQSPAPSPALTVPATPKRWQRPVASEMSEPQVKSPAKPTKSPPAKASEKPPAKSPTKPPAAAALPVVRPATPGGSAVNSGRVTMLATTPSAPANRPVRPATAPLDRPMRWPPAYDVRPPEPKGGRPGVILFEEESEPKPAARSAARPELQRQVKSVCGKQARDVSVEAQRDGSVLVRVKVASASVGDKLTHKILTIPEMGSPKVRLTMDIVP